MKNRTRKTEEGKVAEVDIITNISADRSTDGRGNRGIDTCLWTEGKYAVEFHFEKSHKALMKMMNLLHGCGKRFMDGCV